MKSGMLVFDQVVHMFDNSAENMTDPFLANRISGAAGLFTNTQTGPAYSPWESQISVEDAHRYLFEESETDMAVAQTVPLMTGWNKGYAPAERQYALAKAYPDRVYFCGGVDPVWQGVDEALRELERQVVEWGAISMKFYQSQNGRTSWRADDREIAYPLYEKALDLGLNHVQFHKGAPFGHENVEDLAPYDLQAAARDFPDLIFVVHHLGDPFVDETINVAARFENIHMTLSTWVNLHPIMPMESFHRLGKCLMFVGEDKLMYGSEAFVWPQVQGLLDMIVDLQMPEELQDGYGYPALTDLFKRKFLGENLARLMGIDLEEKRSALQKDVRAEQ